jgi:sugar lactone lactonase YvrE
MTVGMAKWERKWERDHPSSPKTKELKRLDFLPFLSWRMSYARPMPQESSLIGTVRTTLGNLLIFRNYTCSENRCLFCFRSNVFGSAKNLPHPKNTMVEKSYFFRCMKISRLCLGVAISALLNPLGAFAQALFVNDLVGGNIYSYTTNGTRSTFAAGVGNPAALVFDSAGDLYESDITSGNITEYKTNGATSVIGNVGEAFGMAFDAAGNLFVSSQTGGDIVEFSTNGTSSVFAYGLGYLRGLALNSAGDLFVADDIGGNIYELTPGGASSTFATGIGNPSGLAFNSEGDLFVASENGAIYSYTPGGIRSTFASGLNAPWDLAFNSAGNLFESDNGNGYPGGANIYEYTPSGVQSTFATGLYNPNGLAFQGLLLPVPEPSTYALLGLGALALLVAVRRRRRTS